MVEDRKAFERELPRQTNFEDSLALAKEQLTGLDFDEQCQRAGLKLCEEGARLRFVNREFLVRRKGFELEPVDQGPPPELWERIIALHYLIRADGSPDAGDLITYKQVPDGAPYYAVFQRRTSSILLSAFTGRFDELVTSAKKLGADDVKGHGDLAFKVRALPRVEYLFVLYEGDEEFPPEITVLFDSSFVRRLSAEDITVLCQMICLKLLRV